jgi:hypothetical protein
MRFAKLLDIVGVLIALAVGFGAGSATAVLRHWGQPVTTVQVHNVSGQAISSIVLTSRTWKSATTSELGPLAAGAQTTYKIFVAGEGSYQVRATLADGRVLEGGAGYAQAGDARTELLHADSIESRSRFGL